MNARACPGGSSDRQERPLHLPNLHPSPATPPTARYRLKFPQARPSLELPKIYPITLRWRRSKTRNERLQRRIFEKHIPDTEDYSPSWMRNVFVRFSHTC